MKVLAILLAALSLPAFATESTIDDLAARDLGWVDDASLRAQVVDYAKAGQPYRADYDLLPSDVKTDIVAMAAQRFNVESDYDQRITKLYVLSHGGNVPSNLDVDGARAIALRLNVPAAMIGTIHRRYYTARERQFIRNFEGLYINGEYVSDTSVSTHITDLVSGKNVVVHTFGPEEVTLYPGGGFNVTFYLIVTDSHLIYAKKEWWNS